MPETPVTPEQITERVTAAVRQMQQDVATTGVALPRLAVVDVTTTKEGGDNG